MFRGSKTVASNPVYSSPVSHIWGEEVTIGLQMEIANSFRYLVYSFMFNSFKIKAFNPVVPESFGFDAAEITTRPHNILLNLLFYT